MRKRNRKIAIRPTSAKTLLLLLLFNTGFGNAFAQLLPAVDGLAPDVPPPATVREQGVDPSTSALEFQHLDISVGSGTFPGKLELTRSYDMIGYPLKNYGQTIASQKQYFGMGLGYSHNLLIYMTCNSCNTGDTFYSRAQAATTDITKAFLITITALGKSYHFGSSQQGQNAQSTALFYANDDEGATFTALSPPSLSYKEYVLTTKDGTKIYFSDSGTANYDRFGGRYAQYVEFPDGQFLLYRYEPSPYSTGSARLASITNSKGYGFDFSYTGSSGLNPDALDNTATTDNSLLTRVDAHHFNCQTTNYMNCSKGTLPYVNYSYSGIYLTSFIDPSGNPTSYQYDAQGRITAISLPNALAAQSQPSRAFGYTNWSFDVTVHRSGGVTFPEGVGSPVYAAFQAIQDSDYPAVGSTPATITDGLGNVTVFSFNLPDYISPVTLTVTRPDGSKHYYESKYCIHQSNDTLGCLLDPWYLRAPTLSQDGLGNTTIYSYDSHGRENAVTHQEGDSISVSRDSNGNITEARRHAKPGSGLADIVASAIYSTCDSINYKWCNKAISSTDANNKRTDFQYDNNSGGIAVELLPADASNTRAVTRYTYGSFVAASLPPGAGTLPASVLTAPTIHLLAQKDACLTSSVTGTNVDFSYTCGVGNRRRDVYNYGSAASYELTSQVSDADGVSATTSYTYDVVGNVVSTSDPMGNVSYVTYDPSRRQVFEIGATPGDGNPRPMVHHIYDGNGNETRTEIGVGQSLDGSDFILLHYKDFSYNGNDQLIQVRELTP